MNYEQFLYELWLEERKINVNKRFDISRHQIMFRHKQSHFGLTRFYIWGKDKRRWRIYWWDNHKHYESLALVWPSLKKYLPKRKLDE